VKLLDTSMSFTAQAVKLSRPHPIRSITNADGT